VAQLVALFEIDETEYAMRMVVFAWGLKKRKDRHGESDGLITQHPFFFLDSFLMLERLESYRGNKETENSEM
jgi:hypothetical protein